jgi:hypothetical protein
VKNDISEEQENGKLNWIIIWSDGQSQHMFCRILVWLGGEGKNLALIWKSKKGERSKGIIVGETKEDCWWFDERNKVHKEERNRVED